MSAKTYHALAEKVAAAILSGTLRPGDRLPTQRTYAFETGVAVSTASRVYAELLRRGLIVGEVGRGTFVAAPRELPRPVEAEWPDGRRDDRIDLEYNFPILPGQSELIAKSLAGLNDVGLIDRAMRPVTGRQIQAARIAVGALLGTSGWKPEPDRIIFTGSGRQSVASAIATVVPVGGRLGVEALTYPSVKRIAARLGVTLVPIAMDEGGILPDAIERAHQAAPLSAVYVQPVLHNPLGISLSPERR